MHKAFPLPAAAQWPVKGECLRTSLSYLMGRPSAVKGLVILAFLSFPVPVAARFFAKHLAIGGALAFRWCAHGARTAKLLRTWHVRSIGFPVALPLEVSRFAKGGPPAPRPCG